MLEYGWGNRVQLQLRSECAQHGLQASVMVTMLCCRRLLLPLVKLDMGLEKRLFLEFAGAEVELVVERGTLLPARIVTALSLGRQSCLQHGYSGLEAELPPRCHLLQALIRWQ